mmetsp:Transcript_51929/g.121542  ORF Transcript_51929/g.121542 Transcript_51929/m.121542 type:complete len:389 (-) Transcript_51929:216-1382(-)
MSRGGLDSDRFHNALHRTVSDAVVQVHHLETSWSQQEMTRRITKYIRNAATSDDVLAMDEFPGTAKKLVDYGMSAFCAACEDRPWYFEIDLVPAFNAAAWEVYGSLKRRVNYDHLCKFVRAEYERQVDKTLVTKSLWDKAHEVHRDSTIANKVYNALWKTWGPTVEDCKKDTRPLGDRKRAEVFLQAWLEASMTRAWSALEHSNELSEERMIKLFRGVVKPFGGHDNQFTCIPKELLHRWPPSYNFDTFIEGAVRQLLHSWRTESHRPAKKRKVKASSWETKGEVEDDVENPEEDEFARAEAAEATFGAEEAAVEPGEAPEGHPECTSVEDCIGKPEDRLVQHVLDDADAGEGGDVYCASCWASFLQEQGRQLEGRWLDDGSPYPVPS